MKKVLLILPLFAFGSLFGCQKKKDDDYKCSYSNNHQGTKHQDGSEEFQN